MLNYNTELSIDNDWPRAWLVLFTFGPIYKPQAWQVLFTFDSITSVHIPSCFILASTHTVYISNLKNLMSG